MVDGKAGIPVAGELQEVHQVIRVQLIRISLIGSMDRQQWKRHLTNDISTFQRHICIAQLTQLNPFIDTSHKIVVIVLSTKYAFNPCGIAEVENRIRPYKRRSVNFALVKLLIWCIP